MCNFRHLATHYSSAFHRSCVCRFPRHIHPIRIQGRVPVRGVVKSGLHLKLTPSSPKLIPWFVSDVTPADFSYTIASLLDTNFFQEASDREKDLLVKMAGRWRTYWDQGVFQLAVPADSALGAGPEKAPLGQFWTTPWPYWDLKLRDRDLWEHLSQSGLVVFKVRDFRILYRRSKRFHRVI